MKEGIVTTLLEHRHDFGFMAFCVLSTSIIRSYITAADRSLVAVLSAFLCVLPIGLVAGWLAIDYNLSDSVVIAIVCAVGYFGNSLLRSAVANEGYLGTLIKRALENLTDKYTGK